LPVLPPLLDPDAPMPEEEPLLPLLPPDSPEGPLLLLLLPPVVLTMPEHADNQTRTIAYAKAVGCLMNRGLAGVSRSH
jgi:hypothetical protein